MDAALYVGRVAFAAIALLAVLVRVAHSALRIESGHAHHAPNILLTFAYAYLLIADVLTFFPH